MTTEYVMGKILLPRMIINFHKWAKKRKIDRITDDFYVLIYKMITEIELPSILVLDVPIGWFMR